METPLRLFFRTSHCRPSCLTLRSLIGLLLVPLIGPTTTLGQPTFQPLGVARSYYDFDNVRVSNDGLTVVFTSSSENHTRAFRWREETGAVPLPMPSDDGRKAPESYCTDVSGNGSRIVGRVHTSMHDYACVWENDQLPTALIGRVSEFYLRDYFAISADGSTVVGSMDHHPTRWTDSALPQPLPAMPSFPYGRAWAVSADGSVIVGTVESGTNRRGFRWTASEGTVSLSGGQNSQAWFVSDDGSTCVGSQAGIGSCRWTQGEQVSGISGGGPFAVSGDGTVVAGFWSHAGDADWYYAAIWLPDGQRRDLVEYLRGIGTTGLDGWRLLWVDDISADAHTLVGLGRNPAGLYDYWIANIGPLCSGDANVDRVVDLADLAIILANFGASANAVRLEGDLDDDGVVGIEDLMQVLTSFGQTCE